MKRNAIILLIFGLLSLPAIADSEATNRPQELQQTISPDVRLLDSMTYFQLVEVRVSHKPAGWYLRPNLKFKGTIPNRSAIRISLSQKGRALAKLRCGIEKASVFRCYDKKQVVKQIGLIDVDIRLINGDTDQETPLRKLRIDVRKTNKFNNYNDYYVNRHPDVAVAYLSLEGKNPWVMSSRADRRKGSNRLFLNTVISRNHLEKYNGGEYMRCKLNGQPFKLKNRDVSFNEKEGSVFVTYESRKKSGTKKGAVNKDYLKFGLQQIQLPLSSGAENNFTNDVSKSPGDWECSILGKADRELIRRIRFTVDASGQIVPHPEQRNGNVVFGDWEWMIDMDVPDGGSPIDHRLLNSPKMGFFHGIPWSTPEGKAMAARLPTKGSPFAKAAR